MFLDNLGYELSGLHPSSFESQGPTASQEDGTQASQGVLCKALLIKLFWLRACAAFEYESGWLALHPWVSLMPAGSLQVNSTIFILLSAHEVKLGSKCSGHKLREHQSARFIG